MCDVSNRYVGITIGPILNTLTLASSPASLWAASYFFSTLAKSICEVLTEEYGVTNEQIITPYFNKEDSQLNANSAVGLFHDRIIFNADCFDDAVIDEVKEKALIRAADLFGLLEHLDYLKEYVRIAHISFYANNPLFESSVALDCLELAQPYVFKETVNPLLQLFNNSQSETNYEGRNEAIKKLTRKFEGFQLAKNQHSLKSLYDIAHTGDGYKKFNYYAIVRADSDNMGKIICNLKGDENIRKFSKTCLLYCSRVAELVGKYYGATIYSGGDDLLAIMPCESKEGKSVFEFVTEANELFADCLTQNNLPSTSLSFGISIVHYKFPLYEAFEHSAELLFQKAKKRKNCTAVHLQKHSGQSEGLIITNDTMPKIVSYLKGTINKDTSFLSSSLHKLRVFEQLFEHAKTKSQIENLFINIFDAPVHTDNNFLHTTLPELFWSVKTQTDDSGIFAITDDEGETTDSNLILQHLLRIFKFFVEKGGEAE